MSKHAFSFLLLFWFSTLSYQAALNQNLARSAALNITVPQLTETSNSIQNDIQTLDGYYYGVSKDGFGQRAWFLQFDSEKKTGFFYLPPGLRKISQITVGVTGQVSFRTGGVIGGVLYNFSGQFNQNNLRGVIKTTRLGRKTSENLNETEVSFEKIDMRNLLMAQPSPLYGLYSNVEYHQDGGDLIGFDLILFPTTKGIRGIFTPYDEGVTTYALLNVKNTGNKLEFEIETQEGKEHYSGSITPKIVKLRRDDAEANLKMPPWVLPKKKTIYAIFSQKR
jgi:hypothetical protein